MGGYIGAAVAERLKIIALMACLVLFGFAVGGLVAGNSLGWAACSHDTGKDVSE